MKPTPSIDTDKPALSLETIAATITPDPVRKDERDVANMGMNHWNEGMNARSLKTTVDFLEIAERTGIPTEFWMSLNDFLYIREDGETLVPITYLKPEGFFRWSHNFQDYRETPWSQEMNDIIDKIRPLAARLYVFATGLGITHLNLAHTPSKGDFKSPHIPL